ncbi:hypothetical protein ACN28G_22635 [Micromonospora sp. WMMA1923]|uniref:hypothetical protein n=1 Tax=Micromonospora sp. WMMA1923 TaxID=3404125 RepID=UPI003B966104
MPEQPSTVEDEAPVPASASEPAGTVAPTVVDPSTVRMALVVGGLLLAVLLGFGLGRINPRETVAGPMTPAGGTVGGAAAGGGHSHAPGTGAHQHDGADPDDATGLSVTSAGYTLVPSTPELPAGQAGELRFQVHDGQRKPVTRFAVVHDKPLHLIVVRRDLSGYQHLHPTMAPDGTWSIPLTLTQPGVWRMYADFTAVADDGLQTAVTLGVDLTAPGQYAPVPLPAPAQQTIADGFTVSYQGEPKPGVAVPLVFTIEGADGAVPTLERYLGAYGHLVALRSGDLGYLHVHPEPELDAGAVKFWVTAPGPGSYRLYLDFQVAGEVRTAEFTLTVA